jgi:hypothetical protein
MTFRILAVWIAGQMAVFPAGGSQTQVKIQPWNDWGRVASLKPQQKIRIVAIGPKRKIQGRYVSSDTEGITIENASGRTETVPRADVRRILSERKVTKAAVLIAAAAGAVILGFLVAGPGWDLSWSGKAIFVGAGAGLGALGGWGVGAMARAELIYEAPRK